MSSNMNPVRPSSDLEKSADLALSRLGGVKMSETRSRKTEAPIRTEAPRTKKTVRFMFPLEIPEATKIVTAKAWGDSVVVTAPPRQQKADLPTTEADSSITTEDLILKTFGFRFKKRQADAPLSPSQVKRTKRVATKCKSWTRVGTGRFV